MLLLGLLCMFFAIFTLFLAAIPGVLDTRPTLKITSPLEKTERLTFQKTFKGFFRMILSQVALINKPLTIGPLGRRINRDLGMGKMAIKAEEFLLIKEVLIIGLFLLALTMLNKELLVFGCLMAVAMGYFLPELWLKQHISKVKDAIVRDLPDTVDLLGLCVNAGLDFMMALKYVVEKSKATVIVDELRNMIQEINVGKPRRDALRDMSRKYELADLSTFSRTLIQADRMGTSVTDALNILSEDMREARFRRGEAMAMKAPLKMLVPLLFCIFPVVAILVAGPVFLDFFQNNPLKNLAK